jgi:hypothetical protein
MRRLGHGLQQIANGETQVRVALYPKSQIVPKPSNGVRSCHPNIVCEGELVRQHKQSLLGTLPHCGAILSTVEG